MTGERSLILHDFFAFPGGGEKVAMILARSFQAELWTGHLDKGAFFEGYFDDLEPKSLEAYETSPRLFGFSKTLQLWWSFAHFPAASTAWTIFSGAVSPLSYKRIQGNKIYYCLTPPRLLYDQKRFLLQQAPGWQRLFLMLVASLFRPSYERAVRGMDTIVTISEAVRARTMRYLGYDSLVVYPPCETARFRWIEEGDFFLSTARVDPLKRVSLIVEAFLTMPEKRLVVVSGGSDMPRIKKMAERVKNIDILGWVDDEKLRDLIGRCMATIYIPRDEDFGISPVESMAAGKPVIGVQEGALLETVGESGGQRPPRLTTFEGNPVQRGKEIRGQRAETGRRFLVTDYGVLAPKDPGVGDIIEAVAWMTPARAVRMRRACEARARCFDTDVFLKGMRGVLGEV